MPIYVGYTQKRRRVKLLTAGDTLYFLCPPGDITLEATVSDTTNLRNHILLWEQTKGPDVIFSATDQLSTTFPFADTDDKEFRFYLDKGTPQEQMKDLEVFYTPTSTFKRNGASANAASVISALIPNLQIVGGIIFPEPDGTVNDDLNLLPGTDYTFDQSTVAGMEADTIYKMELLSSDVYTKYPNDVISTYYKGNLPTELTLPRGVYKLKAYFDLLGYKTEAVSPLIVSNPYPVEGKRGIQDLIVPGGVTGTFSGLVRTSISRLSVDSTTIGLVSLATGNNLATDRFTFLLLSPTNRPELLSEYSTLSGATGSFLSVTRSNPSQIGNA